MAANKDETYNGWSNYETWAAALWINNDQGSQEQATELVRGLDRYDAAEALREMVEEWSAYTLTGDPDGIIPASLASDLLNAAMSSVDWYEVADSILAGLSEEATV